MLVQMQYSLLQQCLISNNCNNSNRPTEYPIVFRLGLLLKVHTPFANTILSFNSWHRSVELSIFCILVLRSETGSFIQGAFGFGSGEIWLDDVRCNGTETDIDECGHSHWGSHNCNHTEDVSISCGKCLCFSLVFVLFDISDNA